MGSFWSKYIIFELKKYRGVMFNGTEDLMQNLKDHWFALSKMTWRICQIFIHRLKSSYFILYSEMAELNQNKNWKQPDQPDAVWKLYLALEINE